MFLSGKQSLIGFFLILLVPVMAFTSGQEEVATDEPVTIWFATLFHADAPAMERIVDEFNRTHDDIQIDLTQGSWTEYYAQLQNAVVAGEPPQIAISHDWRLPTLYPALTALNDSPAGDLLSEADLQRADYIEYVWDLGEIEGIQYGVPLDTHMLGIYYNKEIFEEAGLDPENPPVTREEFDAAADAIADVGYYAYHPGAYGASRWYRRTWYTYLWQNGGALIENNRAAFNTDIGLEALEYLLETRDRGWNQEGTNGASQFDAGELGMMINGTWHYNSLQETDFEWGFMGIPEWFDTPYSWGANHFLVIPKQPEGNTAELRAAITAVEWISRNSHTWGIYGGHIPMRKEALESDELRASETWGKTLATYSEMAFEGVYHSLPRHEKIAEVNAAIEPYIERAYLGTLSPEEALNLAERDVNEVLSE